MISGTKLFVEALKKEGVDTLFAYPGGFVLDLFDELYKEKDINVILPRHEQALVHAADGYARSTGKVGVCLVTSGPGATNIVTGVATANYDSVPLVCFTGQVPTSLIGNDAFQEVDIVGITRSITKHSTVVTSREDLGRTIKEAFFIASTGKPGPVVVDLPANIMKELGDSTYLNKIEMRSYKPNLEVHIGQIKRVLTKMKNAKKPLILAGGGVNISRANKYLTELAEVTNIPVVTTIMGKGAIPSNHKLFVGNVGMHGSYAANQAVNECDLLISIGTRFNDRLTGKLNKFAPNAIIIHIDIDTASISRNVKVDIPIVGDAKDAINKLLRQDLSKLRNYDTWNQLIQDLKIENPLTMDTDIKHTFSPERIIDIINKRYKDLIVVTDVGQHQMWTTQFLELDNNKKLLTSGGLGTMGYGLPGAIGAKIGNPERKILCITGDGGMQMNMQELATAVAQELPILIIIFNNSYLGMVRQSQDLFYNKRYSSTCLRYTKSCEKNCLDPNRKCPPYRPDFIKLAETYDFTGIRVNNEKDFIEALGKADDEMVMPTIIECIIKDEFLVLPMVRSGSANTEMILG